MFGLFQADEGLHPPKIVRVATQSVEFEEDEASSPEGHCKGKPNGNKNTRLCFDQHCQ